MQKFLIAALSLTAISASAAELKKDAIYVPAADLKWEQPFGPQGPSVAIAAGDGKKGPVGFFMKFTPGADAGWHTHDNAYVSVVIKGTLTSQGQGDAAATNLPVGSFFSEPAKKNHRNTCTAEGECIIFGYYEKGGMTYNPKTADGKTPPKEAAPAAPAKEAPKKEEGKK